MAASTEHPQVSRCRLWFGVLGGGLAWSLHLAAASVTSEWGCVAQVDQWEYLGVSAVVWMIVGWSVVSLAMAACATWVAWVNHRILSAGLEPDDQAAESGQTGRFLALTGLYTSAAFVFIILAQSVPILFYLSEC